MICLHFRSPNQSVMLQPEIEGTSETNRVRSLINQLFCTLHFIGTISRSRSCYNNYVSGKAETEEDQRHTCYMAAEATGGPGGRTHLISNYTKENNYRSLVVERAALDTQESPLISAESFIRVRKQKENNQIERELMAPGIKIMPTVAVLSTALGYGLGRCSRLRAQFIPIRTDLGW